MHFVRTLSRRFLLIFLLAFSYTLWANEAVRLTGENPGNVDLAGSVERYYDPSNNLSIADIPSLADAGKFQTIKANDSLGYVSGTVWLRFRIDRLPEALPEWWLEARRPSIDEIDLYQRDASGAWQVSEQGDHRPWATREIRNRNSVFVLQPNSGENTYFLRIRTSSSSAVALSLWSPHAFAAHAAQDMILISGFVLTLAVIVLINLMQAFMLRERLYLLYSANLASFGIMMALVEGWVHGVIQPAAPLPLNDLVSLMHPLVALTMGLLFRDIVELRRHLPRIDKVFLFSITSMCVIGVLAVPLGLDSQLKPWLWKALLLEMTVNTSLSIWLALHGNRQARFYLLAFGALLAGGSHSILANLGLLPSLVWGHVLPVAGSIVHMVLMQLTVNDRVHVAKHAFDRAREQALAAEQLATEGLNREVSRRTEALENALANEQDAVERQKMFVRIISHEFRTPLAIIDASAGSLALQNNMSADGAVRCRNIRNGIRRLTDLLAQCAADSRLDDEYRQLQAAPVAIAELVEQSRQQLAFLAPERNVLYCLDKAPATIHGEAKLLDILLSNLLSNALKYSAVDTEIRLIFAVKDAELCVTVIDHGQGIPADELPHVFDKHMRGKTLEKIPGLGLGLALVKRITELHGGHVEIDSSIGEGTTVRVFLPLAS